MYFTEGGVHYHYFRVGERKTSLGCVAGLGRSTWEVVGTGPLSSDVSGGRRCRARRGLCVTRADDGSTGDRPRKNGRWPSRKGETEVVNVCFVYGALSTVNGGEEGSVRSLVKRVLKLIATRENR